MKFSFLLATLSLISLPLWADDEVNAIVEKVNGFGAQKCANTSQVAEERQSQEVQVGFLRGSPIDAFNAPQAGEDYLEISRKVLEKQSYQVTTMSAHHTSWQKMCNEFKKKPSSRIVLVGHSYGSSGAVKVANCLAEQKIETEFLITVSSFDFLAGVDVTRMPAHVKNHLNLRVSDPLIPGYKLHTALQPSQTRIENVEAQVSGASPHIQAVDKLLPLLGLVTMAQISGMYDAVNLKTEVSNSELRSNLAKYWNCVEIETPEPGLIPKEINRDDLAGVTESED